MKLKAYMLQVKTYMMVDGEIIVQMSKDYLLIMEKLVIIMILI